MNAFAQRTRTIIGTVEDAVTQEKIIGANIIAEKTSFGTITDFNGNFKLNLPVGSYSITVSTMGYRTPTQYNVVISSGNDQIVRYKLHPDAAALGKVVITNNRSTTAVATHMITSMSVQRLTSQEIKASPRGDFDVSKVVQTLLGVGLSNGLESETTSLLEEVHPLRMYNYLDGIEIPVLNHFQTQGSSAGAQGILNISFIDDLKLTTSAFDPRYNDALSSTFVINQRNRNPRSPIE